MDRLTHERNNSIKTGYWSPNKKDELVERLAAYEDTGLTPEEIMDGRMLAGWISTDEQLPDLHKGWMKVSEQPPKELRRVLIQNIYGLITVGERWGDRWFNFSGDELTPAEYWMPLPEPYKEVKK